MPDSIAPASDFGLGPLEQVFRQWRSGRIGKAVALHDVTQPSFASEYSPGNILWLSDAIVRHCYTGEWEAARDLHELLRACIASDPARFAAVRATIAIEQLRIATNALWHRPDARVYRDAVQSGLATLEQSPTPDQRAQLTHELGILHLDPWAADRTDVLALKRWWQSATDAASAQPDAAHGLPDAKAALQQSEVWLRKALPLRTGIARLETLKALLQCLFAIPIHGGTLNEVAARSLLAEAMSMAEAASHRPDILSFLQQVADHLVVPFESPELDRVMETDWFAKVDAIGFEVVAAQLMPALVQMGKRDPVQALLLAERVQPLIESHAAESMRTEFHTLVANWIGGNEASLPPGSAEIDATLQLLAASQDTAERHDAIRRLMEWIRGLAGEDREDLASVVLGHLTSVAPELMAQWGTSMQLLAGQLMVGAAVNARNAHDFDACVRLYFGAWQQLAAAHFSRTALSTLARIPDVIPEADARSAQIVCELLREEATPIGTELEDDWHSVCQQLAAATMLRIGTSATADAWFAALRLAKGPSFANLVTRDESYDWQQDREALRLMKELDGLASAATPLMEADAVFEFALTCYHSTPLETAGATPSEQRDNLARTFDLHVQGRLAELSRRQNDRFTIDAACERLPEDAVLLDFYQPTMGVTAGAACLVAARDGMKVFVGTDAGPIKEIQIAGSTAEYAATPSGFAVAELRRELQLDPLPGAVATMATLDQLESCTARFLGPALDYLETLHAGGKRHLVVSPGGPLHFFPLHLLGRRGTTLADSWIVTYLPTVDLLRRTATASARAGDAAVFGISYAQNTNGLIELPQAKTEAIAVAATLGVTPVLDDAVTRDAVLTALKSGSLLHIACHGQHDVVAPSLQALLLTPSGGSDGRLTSVDLHSLDLSALSVLALSACETALGRFDAGDNLRGFTASALAAGAGCVVGTLWPTTDAASAMFFTTLFQHLTTGAARVSAFAAAQAATRTAFPEYRDWAQFYLAGNW